MLYELCEVGRTFPGPGDGITVLNAVSLGVEAGESVAILGASGSGKTTLLYLMGGLDRPSRGVVRFQGTDMGTLDPPRLAALRNRELGFVFQFHHLLPEFSTLENVAMPGLVAGLPRQEALALAAAALERMGMGARTHHRVTTLSGGEQQRVAIARAILLSPKALLADEPTGNLDEKTGELVGSLLKELNEERGMALVVVTHNHCLARMMHRQLELSSGELYARAI